MAKVKNGSNRKTKAKYDDSSSGSSLTPSVGTSLTNGGAASIGATQATASVSPTGNSLQLLIVDYVRGSSTDPTAPTSVTGCGLTWVLVATLNVLVSGTTRNKAYVFRALGAAPSTGALTITNSFTSATPMRWALAEFSHVDTTGSDGANAVVQHVENTGTSATPSATLAAFSATANGTVGLVASHNNDVTGAGTGFSLLSHGFTSTAGAAIEFRNDNDTSVDCSHGFGSTQFGVCAIELKCA